jgi:hypothetical protein
MKRLAFLSFAIATLLAPITVQAQTACVSFPQPSNPEAEVAYPSGLAARLARITCPAAARLDPIGTGWIVQRGLNASAAANHDLRGAMSGGR